MTDDLLLKAACRGSETKIFFPHDSTEPHRWDQARSICKPCPVKKWCLLDALAQDELNDGWGMFGGRTPQERLVIRENNRKREI